VQEVVPEERGGPGARPAALSCTGLVKRYGQAVAVDGVDLVVERGRVVGLVGPNGSGKTTTLRLCAGIAPPDEGSVLVDGLPHGRPAARSRVGYVPDEPTGLDELTVGEYLDLVRALYRAGPAYIPRAQTLLAAFRLDGRERALLGSLSHGARRATAVAAAFALRPAVAIVDEASAALDPEAVVALRDAVRALAFGGAGVLLATQDLSFAERTCHEVVILASGRVAASGPVSTPGSLERAVLAAIGEISHAHALRSALGCL
jgi:ABC-2 type transport system ATP-binding protein